MQYVIKADGSKEKFKPHKIERTVLKAGGSKQSVKQVLKEIRRRWHKNMTTREVLDITLGCLKKEPGAYERYDLKRAIMQLGPTGYPFEKFFALILKNHGYDVKINQMFRGKVVRHEIDVVAKDIKTKKRYMVEAKYHNSMGIHTKVKIPLYVYARFLDIKNNFDFPWLVTNTKCTPDALNYAKGVNMRVTSWNYPKDESLQKLIEKKNLYPITVLKNISKHVKERLFEGNVLLVRNLVEYNLSELKRRTHLPTDILKKMISEAQAVLS